MHALTRHEISEANHRILNPFTDEKLMLLGEVCRLQPDDRQLDLACGKGEMLCRWAERFGIAGIGVDISTVFVPLAEARAAELGVSDRLRFLRADASTYQAEPGGFDVVSCIGATWIGDGVAGTIDLLRPALRPGGLLLIGEPFWKEDPPDEAYGVTGFKPGEFASLEGTLDRFEGAGASIVEMVMADGASWDRYDAGQWWTLSEWLRANPDHLDHDELKAYLSDIRRAHFAYRRRYLGWGVFVTRLD